MFDQFKQLGAVAGLLKNQDQLRETAERVKEELHALRLEGESGGGAVRVTVNGRLDVLAVELQPALASGMTGEAERERAQLLIVEATNAALLKAQEAAKKAIAREAEALGIPGIADKLGGGLGGLLG
ncbi:MAG: YbaB/EbfC family nucleoid-associated protein [Planctomycetota bacterium]